MIREINISDSKISNLRGDHYADIVYCRKLVKHPGDVHYAWLHCTEVVEELPPDDSSTLSENDRIYKGELHIRGIYGIDESGLDQTSRTEAEDFHGQGFEL
ncbi:hypothetical protein [Serratia phage X20]|uniref:DUF7418 domain-containing protein n=3 Tax=Winklervirus TaxID=2560256 RepID=A0A1Z1LZJ9_9CAUD|nr:hypothetical protein FDI23_gp142 [Serratia phage CHI14]YP_010092426.1 hypothetical protein KNT72_gp140 [Serratia phage X20]ARW57971.1 hypothetical protein [Serratia phage CBH8]QYN80716.1 hypothetical protein [Kosakonia phage Kc304]UJJ22271.1 hypothetical protein [Erwinia phage Virsaitis27]UYM28925.1 hypothetical protein [Serratia phage vB_SspM_LC53]ARW57696.1 hypothetical protein [Serratia phage CHI14]